MLGNCRKVALEMTSTKSAGESTAEPWHSLGLEPRPSWRPYLMGVVNATPDSFSDLPGSKTIADRVELAERLIADGADIIDVGGESGVTSQPAVSVEQEIERVVPIVEAISQIPGAVVSIDTYKPAVARAATSAGARLINDVSGLADVDLAAAAAGSDAAIVLMHTRARPKQKLFPHYDDVVADVQTFLSGAIARAAGAGVPLNKIILDPGPDFAKTPAQTIEVLRELPQLAELGHPILLAISRKDFVGALLDRGPRERDAGTLAALAAGVSAGASVVRVHDVAAADDFLRVRAALAGELAVPNDLELAPSLRRVGEAESKEAQ